MKFDVIGFGPLSAEDVMKEALTYGIDNAFLINDPQFADMDISQTARIVAKSCFSLSSTT